MTDWDSRFMGLSKHIAAWSKDPSTQVGAVIVDKRHRIVSLGFNGFPVGVLDDGRLLDRDIKNNLVVHAEINAILFAGRGLDGCSLYTWPLPPCCRCAAQIIQSGIRFVRAPTVEVGSRWAESCILARAMMQEAGLDTKYHEDWA